MAQTRYSIGQRVRHPGKPEWGTGQVVDLPGDGKVHIDFPSGGIRKLVADGPPLEIVENPAGQINLDKVFQLCDQFRSEMGSNRSNTDDGGIARRIKNDLLKHGKLTAQVEKNLLEWCHTGGSFVKAEAIAHELCVEIYGRIRPRGV